MLKDILRLIESGEVQSLEELSERLDTTVSALDGPIALLLEKGYLSAGGAEGSFPSRGCFFCSKREFCSMHTSGNISGKMYFVTEKGREYIKRGKKEYIK